MAGIRRLAARVASWPDARAPARLDRVLEIVEGLGLDLFGLSPGPGGA